MTTSAFQAARRTVTKCKIFFDKHYLVANIGIYGGLYSLGDITCQTISHANTQLTHDWQRTKRMTVIGCTMLPIMNTYFFRVLDKVIVGKPVLVVLHKLVIDTFVWAPITITAFVSGKLSNAQSHIAISWPQVSARLLVFRYRSQLDQKAKSLQG